MKTPPKPSRRHHYTPVLLLRRFVDANGVLHVISHNKGNRYISTPEGVGFENDFYTINEPPDGEDPQMVEKELAQFEGDASRVLDEVIATRSVLIEQPDKYNILMNFIALSAARIPVMRQLISDPIVNVADIVMHMMLLSEDQFRTSFENAGIDVDATGLTYETAKEIVDGIKLSISTATYLYYMNQVIDTILPSLSNRHWTICHNSDTAPVVVISDKPVAVVWSNGRQPGFYDRPAFGRPGTDVTIPLGSHIALMGCFEKGLPPIMEMDAQTLPCSTQERSLVPAISLPQRLNISHARIRLARSSLMRISFAISRRHFQSQHTNQ